MIYILYQPVVNYLVRLSFTIYISFREKTTVYFGRTKKKKKKASANLMLFSTDVKEPCQLESRIQTLIFLKIQYFLTRMSRIGNNLKKHILVFRWVLVLKVQTWSVRYAWINQILLCNKNYLPGLKNPLIIKDPPLSVSCSFINHFTGAVTVTCISKNLLNPQESIWKEFLFNKNAGCRPVTLLKRA